MPKPASPIARPRLGDMVIGYLFAPLLGGLLASFAMLPFLLILWQGSFEVKTITLAVTANALNIGTLAYKALVLAIPLSLAMRSAGFYGRSSWLLLGFVAAHLVGYGELYGDSQPLGDIVAASAVSLAGLSCGFMFWLLVSDWPQKDRAV